MNPSVPPPPLPLPTAAVHHTGFGPDQLLAIADARARFAPIRRQIALANFDAWSVAIFGGITCAMSLTSVPGLLVGLAMSAVAFVEFRALARLRALDSAAPGTLALNQLALAAVLILYALYSLFLAPPSESLRDAIASNPELAQTDIVKSIDSITRLLTVCVYGGVIVVALIFQGGCALYHFRKTPHLRRYVENSPPWILQLHAAGLMR